MVDMLLICLHCSLPSSLLFIKWYWQFRRAYTARLIIILPPNLLYVVEHASTLLVCYAKLHNIRSNKSMPPSILHNNNCMTMKLFIITVFAVSMVLSQEVRGAKTTHHFHNTDECSCFFHKLHVHLYLVSFFYIAGTSLTGIILRREGRSKWYIIIIRFFAMCWNLHQEKNSQHKRRRRDQKKRMS